MTLILILTATLTVSLISLIGIFTFGMKTKVFDKMLVLFVGFSAGALIGGAFLHLLPEAVEQCGRDIVFFYCLLGFTVFFMMERYLYWRHCHDGVCDVHTFTYLNLIGDGIHNFTDGMLIAASFVADLRLGIVTTLAVISHEIPQEIGDFGVLVYGGMKKRKALFFNFICSLFAILGALIGYLLSNVTENTSIFFVSFTAGGFIYIAASDLIPEMHKQKTAKKANLAFLFFILGIIFMILTKFIV